MDAQAILDQIAKRIVCEVVATKLTLGSFEPDDIDEKIWQGLDADALLEIQKALQFVRWHSDAISSRAQARAGELIKTIKRERQVARGWQAEL